jgi:hypothetical protein
MHNEFEIVLSERDQETLARDLFTDETTLSECEQANSESGRRPLEEKKLSEMLRVATVDNFQGKEAEIVVVSLVRSNMEKKMRFLRTTNRINVLLSRRWMTGGHVLPSGSGRPRLTMAQREGNASIIFSKDPPANVERALIPVDTLQSHNPFLIGF